MSDNSNKLRTKGKSYRMNPALDLLKPYPFERLAELKKDINPNGLLKHISLSIGEPKHETPGFVFDAI